MMKLFHCYDERNMDKYGGYHINLDYGYTFTQPFMLHIFSDDFSLTKQVPNTTEITVKTLIKYTEEDFGQHNR